MTSTNNNSKHSSSSSLSSSKRREFTVYGYIKKVTRKVKRSHPRSIVSRTVFPSPIYLLIYSFYGRVGSYQAIWIGKNDGAQMGLGFGSEVPLSIPSKSTPLPLMSALISNPNDIYIGKHRLLVKDIDGHLHCAGYNKYGDCGINSTEPKNASFTRIRSNPHNPSATVENIQLVSSGKTAYHTVVITSDGDFYSFGANDFGQLCLGFKMSLRDPNHKKFVQRIPEASTKAFSGQTIVDITTGTDHCLFLTDNGAVYGCGSNGYSQLGVPQSQMDNALIPTRIRFSTENGNGNPNVRVRITQI